MAVELAQAYVSITPSARGIGRTLSRELTGPLSSAGASAGDGAASSFGRRFTPALARIGRNAALAFSGAFGAAGLFGVKVAADFEQTRIGFEGILGDAQKAETLLQSLRDFAAKTPFEFTGLADSAKQLLAVGFSADEIIPTMSTLGNVAATLGVGEVEIAGVVRALGQMRGKGKASAEELQQISEQIPGFSAIKAIAEDLGITTAEAFEKMRVGALPADEAIEAILHGMEDFPGAAGAMDRQSKTLNGVLSTFKDTLSGMAIDFITPYLPSLSRGVQAFSGFLEDVKGGLEEFIYFFKNEFDESARTPIEEFGRIAGETFRAVSDAVGDMLTGAFAFLKQWWDDNGETLKSVIADVFGSISGFAADIKTAIEEVILPALTNFFGWFLDEGPGVEIIITGIAIAMGLFAVNAILGAAATVIALFPFILLAAVLGTLIWATGKLTEAFGGEISSVIQFFIDNALNPLLEAAQDVLAAIQAIIDLAKKIPSIPGVGESESGWLHIPGIGVPVPDPRKWFDDGGVMPGPRGVHSLAWVAGGETILPTHKTGIPLTGSLVGGDLIVQQLPGEDAGDAALRGLRKVRLMAGV